MPSYTTCPDAVPLLIGLGGLKTSGKDTAADILVETLGFTKIGMSDPLHQFLLAQNPRIGMPFHEWDRLTQAEREALADREIDYALLTEVLGYDRAKAKVSAYREILQRTGTEAGRKVLGEGLWVEAARNKILDLLREGTPVVVTGIRFRNEIDMLGYLGGTSVWVHRPGLSSDGHESEDTLHQDDFDIVLDNDGTLERLKSRTLAMVYARAAEDPMVLPLNWPQDEATRAASLMAQGIPLRVPDLPLPTLGSREWGPMLSIPNLPSAGLSLPTLPSHTRPTLFGAPGAHSVRLKGMSVPLPLVTHAEFTATPPNESLRMSWDVWALGLAAAVAMRADCTRRQVGAVILDSEHRVISTGYNGLPSGMPGCRSAGTCARGRLTYDQQPADVGYTDAEHPCHALHAEENAVVYARRDLSGCTLYCTHAPCTNCARFLRGAGLARVVWPEGEQSL